MLLAFSVLLFQSGGNQQVRISAEKALETTPQTIAAATRKTTILFIPFSLFVRNNFV